MEKKAVSGLMFTLLLIGMLALAINIQRVKAEDTIYIRANGSIEPPTANITTADNFTYTFTADINDSIVIERSNIVVEGAGYAVEGTRSGNGIEISYPSNVTIKNMKIIFFYCGINLVGSNNNRIYGNNITNNHEGIDLQWSSDNNNVSENNITANEGYGIFIKYSSGISISENNITNNGDGVYMDSSFDSVIYENNITNNLFHGLVVGYFSENRFYHNNLINNNQQVECTESTNTWDDGYPSGGNYWSDYTGVDLHSGAFQNETGSEGLGDTPYVIDADNVDRFPLAGPYNSFYAGTWNEISCYVDVVSNSTVSDFYFDPAEGPFIRFSVFGPMGTVGFSRVVIPKQLPWTENSWTVLIGSSPTTPTVTEDDSYTYLYFTYSQGSKPVVTVIGTNVVPEFPTIFMLPLLIIITMLAVVFAKRKTKRKLKAQC